LGVLLILAVRFMPNGLIGLTEQFQLFRDRGKGRGLDRSGS
jgi:hypothetical protein